MTIFVTNDDGLTDGLRILTEAASRLDKEFYAITPEEQMSAVAKGITLHKILKIRRVESEKLPIYELNGTPADCVSFALCSNEFPRPTLVLSGVNLGDNLSLHSTYSSGTIGACLEAAFYGIPAIAFSKEVSLEEVEKGKYLVWENRELLIKRIVEIVSKVRNHIPPHIVLSVNIPQNFENAEIVFPIPSLTKYISVFDKRLDPKGRAYYWQYGIVRDFEKDTDTYEFFVNKAITITPISIFGIFDRKISQKFKKIFNKK